MNDKFTYFAEVEFATPEGRVYWLPLYFDVPHRSKAETELSAICGGLTEHFTIRRRSGPVIVIEPMNAEFSREYVATQSRGRVAVLDVYVWAMREPEGASVAFTPELTFPPERTVLAFQPDEVGRLIGRRRFPVRVVAEGQFRTIPDFLTVRVDLPVAAAV